MNTNLIRIGLVFLVFLLFLANATGLLNLAVSPHFSVDSQWLPPLPGGDDSLLLPPHVWSTEFFLFTAIGLILSVGLPLLSPIAASSLTLALVIPPFYLNYTGFLQASLLPMEYFMLTILVLFVVNVLFAYFEETHVRQQIINTFSHYVPPEVVRELCKHPQQISLEGESREMSVIFCDLVNFSAIAETMQPTQLTRMLNEYFSRATDVLHKHGATIDKFIGDSVMAFWGAPLAQPRHAEQAVTAAFDLHDSMLELQNDFSNRGLPRIETRIGINSGSMNVGNMGTRHRITYTVIGDAVNVAARIEQLTRLYQVKTIVSEYTSRAADSYLYRLLDLVYIKGRHEPIRIYEPLYRRADADVTQIYLINLNETAVETYLAGNFDKAMELFYELQVRQPNDQYINHMLSRMGTLKARGKTTLPGIIAGPIYQDP